MCGIAGYVSFQQDFTKEIEKHRRTVTEMGNVIRHRGPDDFHVFVSNHVAFAHTRLAVIDPSGGRQPMTKMYEGRNATIVYNGEIYNTVEVRKELVQAGMTFSTSSDTEVVLGAYLYYGRNMVEKLNGIYSFVIWDERNRCVFFCRDRLGVKPLFYTVQDGVFSFASEIKALFAGGMAKPKINKYGLCELFGIGPARVPGCGVYENVFEVLPAHCGCFSESGLEQWCYWQVKAEPVKDTYEQAVERVRELLSDAIQRQLVSDVPVCTLLSGGVDSSVVSAVAAEYLKKQGKVLDTYSFDYRDNDANFQASGFQPEQDRPYVDLMVKHIQANHTYLECNNEDLYDCLFEAVKAKDLPGMTDVDASLLFFTKKVKEKHTVCLSGECADEIFGGYPWFRDKESFLVDRFPWSRDLEFRKGVLRKELREELPMDSYVQAQYERSIRNISLLMEEQGNREELFSMGEKELTPFLEQELMGMGRRALSAKEEEQWTKMHPLLSRREREISALNMKWFMETLLERKDRMSMANGLEVRVPFADHRLVSYLYGLPWSYKYHRGQVKSLLKDAMGQWLPPQVINRKKCPYPKTYDPKFEHMLKRKLAEILSDLAAPIAGLVDADYLRRLMQARSDYGKPWFGQLMATPQMYAYLIQLNFWMEEYKVQICF